MHIANTTDESIATASADSRQLESHSPIGKRPHADFVFFILVNAVLFIRPMDIISSLENWPIYGVLYFICLIFSFRKLLEQLTPQSLRAHPITACVVALLPAVLLSHLSHLNGLAALGSGQEFAKVVLYYLLLVGVVNTPRRLRWFLWWVALFACVHIGLAVLQQHGVIDLPAMRPVEERELAKAAGEIITQYRMCGAGLFHDPNDLAVLAAVTMMLCLYQLVNGAGWQGSARWFQSVLSIAGLILCGHGLLLTQSRGGFLALLAGLAVFFLVRFGLKRSILLAAIALPVIILLFSGRQTDIHMMRRTTTQLRLRFWVQALEMFSKSPVFGIGQGNFLRTFGYVAHNSFVHCFAELGFLGGTLFLGAYYLALWPMYRFHPDRALPRDFTDKFDLYGLRPCLLAMLSVWVVGMLSLSRSYVPPTYMMLGLATVYLNLTSQGSSPRISVNRALVLRLLGLSVAFLAGVYLFVHLFQRA